MLLLIDCSTYQGRPSVISYLWSRSSGVHVAKEVLDPAKWDTAALIAYLQRGRQKQRGEIVKTREVIANKQMQTGRFTPVTKLLCSS